MNRRAMMVMLCAAVSSAVAQQPAAPKPAVPKYKNSALSLDVRVADLLSRMTLEEKFWQLWMVPGDLDSNTKIYEHGVYGLQVRERGVPTPERDPGAAARRMAERLNSIQRFFIEKTRLGIPIIPFEEAVHGLYGNGPTMFPASIGFPPASPSS